MASLMHNQTVKISSEEVQGIFRVILNDIRQNLVFMVQLDKSADSELRGRSKSASGPKFNRKAPMPLCGEILAFNGTVLNQMADLHMLQVIEIERENFNDAKADQEKFEKRKTVMADFLDFDALRSAIVNRGSVTSLIAEAKQRHKVSSSLIYRCWSLLCRYGFSVDSLRPRRDRCGEPGATRDCEKGKRAKSGRKTELERLSKKVGEVIGAVQPGMNLEWRRKIMLADSQIPCPKLKFKEHYQEILRLGFTKTYKDENGNLKPFKLRKGEYPNREQVRRVLEIEIPRLKRLRQKTTKGHWKRNLRALTGRSWEGCPGPGHTWGIDSSIGDIYLRSSINRAWVIGRPIVYMLVDIWSTAIVGFYVCLRGPSWEMAKVAMFNAVIRPELFSELWGFEAEATLNPLPTMPAVVLADNGEYKSFAAKETAFKLIPRLSLTPPYRPDLKGMVEVLHRITKDHQFWVEGAIDARRKELELRKFDPTKAVYTVREYVQHMYNICSEYNLTADRRNRLDTEMIADGAVPSPAGLWRWGHAVGIGTQRSFSEANLIKELLPSAHMTINRDGLKFENLDYKSESISEDQWTALARNCGSWKVPCHYYPGSMSRIWTDNTIARTGLLELALSDHANTAPTNTYEEVRDAFKFNKLDTAQAEHDLVTTQMHFHHANVSLHEQAKAKTKEAIAAYNEPKPSPSEARALEAQIGNRPSAPPVPNLIGTNSQPSIDDEDSSHMSMLKAVLDAMRT
ncbi:transposase [Duganella sp. sic0402]|uniref:transposase n=1 Tax=Duganella sp. sic0402 TaxID=2854786 RepID=UPI001C44E8DA|nr:transposase [Duganella sp. sic0402]MBV7539219.1 transposase [Duganella sp. sic0402]